MDRRQMITDMKAHCNGASFITKKEFAGYLGCSIKTACRKLEGLDRFNNKYYFIRDVVDEVFMKGDTR